jgi:alkanesulfonate monooxygenase SsuD/methylene tetrahydromethanopterin reductase-like flavin-dependent oxidoreductase (luciferase family)
MEETTAGRPAGTTSPPDAGGQVWMHGFPVPGRTSDLARQAEDLGFDGLLLADSQNLVGDPFVELGVVAGATQAVRCWESAGVTPPWRRLGWPLPRRSGSRTWSGTSAAICAVRR